MPALKKQAVSSTAFQSPPILFLIFDRPNKTRKVLERIRQVRPPKLFIAADGPRTNRPGESDRCEKTQKTVLEMIDWPCDVTTLFREKHLGCKNAVSSAITWLFEQVEEGIILEDDCLPDLSFFRFCAEMLEKYRGDERIMMVSGGNLQPVQRGVDSYFFSRYSCIWGWASWRRAWQHYDLTMKEWPSFCESKCLYSFLSKSIAKRREQQFENAFKGKTSTWDTQWLFACWKAQGLTIIPNINLVTNIDSGGTHMKIYDPCVHRPSHAISFPLTHPTEVLINEDADLYMQHYSSLRTWYRNVFLIAVYLCKVLLNNPRKLPGDALTIYRSLVTEFQHRRG